jgi:hypothetical protein
MPLRSRRHQRLAGGLLRVRNLALDEGDLEIFIYVNLLGAQVEDLIGLAENRDDFIGRLTYRDRGWWSCRGLFRWRGLFRCGLRVATLLLISFVVGLGRVVWLNFEDFRDGGQHFIR